VINKNEIEALKQIERKVRKGRSLFLVDDFGQLICFRQNSKKSMFLSEKCKGAFFYLALCAIWFSSIILSVVYLNYIVLVLSLVIFIVTLIRADLQRHWLQKVMDDSKDEIGLLLNFEGNKDLDPEHIKILIDFLRGKDDKGYYMKTLAILFRNSKISLET
jgi:hypothetical protein